MLRAYKVFLATAYPQRELVRTMKRLLACLALCASLSASAQDDNCTILGVQELSQLYATISETADSSLHALLHLAELLDLSDTLHINFISEQTSSAEEIASVGTTFLSTDLTLVGHVTSGNYHECLGYCKGLSGTWRLMNETDLGQMYNQLSTSIGAYYWVDYETSANPAKVTIIKLI